MVKQKRAHRVRWTQEDRFNVAGMMARVIVEEKVTGKAGKFPFHAVINRAQERLGFNRHGKNREYFSDMEHKEFRALVNQTIHALREGRPSPTPSPADAQHVTEASPAPAPQPEPQPEAAVRVEPEQPPFTLKQDAAELLKLATDEDPMAILSGFMESATKLGKLLISEQQSRRILEIRLAAQQRMFEAQQHEISGLRRTLSEIEDAITRPSTASAPIKVEPKAEPPAPVIPSKPVTMQPFPGLPDGKVIPKRPRVFVVGMETRNHAFFEKEYGHKLDLHFYAGGKRGMTMKPRADDHVFVVVDFCGHTMYNRFMDDMKKRGLKDRVKVVNGGMTAMSTQLQDVIANM